MSIVSKLKNKVTDIVSDHVSTMKLQDHFSVGRYGKKGPTTKAYAEACEHGKHGVVVVADMSEHNPLRMIKGLKLTRDVHVAAYDMKVAMHCTKNTTDETKESLKVFKAMV